MRSNNLYQKSTKKQNKKSDNTDDILENIFPNDNLFQGSKSVGTQWRQVRITEGKRLFFFCSLLASDDVLVRRFKTQQNETMGSYKTNFSITVEHIFGMKRIYIYMNDCQRHLQAIVGRQFVVLTNLIRINFHHVHGRRWT
jgi:hypothetical protein